MATWEIQQAKTKLSEVIEQAIAKEPQISRGRPPSAPLPIDRGRQKANSA